MVVRPNLLFTLIIFCFFHAVIYALRIWCQLEWRLQATTALCCIDVFIPVVYQYMTMKIMFRSQDKV
uniref:Putative secreted protein n=1 Tax=Ixodes ricinus TaxID=34613 RepID=A0A6B0TW61_IXORI